MTATYDVRTLGCQMNVHDSQRIAGMLEAAHSIVDYGIKVAPSAEVKGRFEALKKSFPPEPPPAPNSGSATKATAK